MIQVESIRIREFRGIRDLELTLSGESFVVWGPNGSGKSGVVDAIDFAITGEIARLRGPGSGGLTVARHGPHVHRRDDPAAAKVDLEVRDTESGESALLSRCVQTPKTYTLTPDLPGVRAAVEQAQSHPELTLSRREIIKYIIAEPGARAQEVQALLQLDRLGAIRSLLRSVQNKAATAAKAAATEVDAAEESVRRHLDIPALLTSEVALEVNKRRKVLGLVDLDVITLASDLTDGVQAADGPIFNKASAVSDVSALLRAIGQPADLEQAVSDLQEAVDSLASDPGLFGQLEMRRLVELGLEVVDSTTCPLCDKDWEDEQALRGHLAEKLAQSAAASQQREQLLVVARRVATEIHATRELARAAESHATYGAPGLVDHVRKWNDDLASSKAALESIDGILRETPRLAEEALRPPEALHVDLVDLLSRLEAKPDQTAETEARTYLTVAQERWLRLRSARAAHDKAGAAHTAAKAVYDSYCAALDGELGDLYRAVEADFSAFYRAINADDEATFKAQLDPTGAKLDLTVDFYGVGMFPPAAYHSEGHQDGMGVCLYLALVKRLLGPEFRFAVLDDVVMSVDSNHRRQFCRLLSEEFPNVQFVITTHDEVWARQIQSSGLVGKSAQAQFHGWTVDDGPAYESGVDFMAKVREDLDRDDVPAAAARLRRNLESSMTELAMAIRAQVTIRPDSRYELGELLSSVKGRHAKLLKAAAAAAESWQNIDAAEHVKALKDARSAAVLAQEGENWVVNTAVHYNEWAALSVPDFAPVVDAWEEFMALFSCDNEACTSSIYLSGTVGQEDSLRCNCGAYDLNLRRK